MNTEDKNLQSILKHIDNVRSNCILLGNKIIDDGNLELGKALIANGYNHDNSKLHGIELLYLNEKTKEENPLLFNTAYLQHVSNNKHHPEAWIGGIESMDELHLLEMICDWDSRSFEFNTNSMDWFKDIGANKYNIKPNSRLYKFIHN